MFDRKSKRRLAERAILDTKDICSDAGDWMYYETKGSNLLQLLLDKIEEIYDLERNHRGQ